MSVKIAFGDRDGTTVEETDAVDFEASDITQSGGWLVIKLLDAENKVLSVHTNVRSVWK